VNDIKTKISVNNYTDTDKLYLEGAISTTEYLLHHTEIVSYTNNGATGWYENGTLYATYTGKETEDDVKVSVFHEYLHHINYLYKIFPYCYSNEEAREIYVIEDSCFYYREKTMKEVYIDFTTTLNYRLISECWAENYIDLKDKQKQEVAEYRRKNSGKYDQVICNPGLYKPSNYYKDEINVYSICLKLNGVLFNMSEKKNEIYHMNSEEYINKVHDSENYEIRNNINKNCYEK
jgi:hypothetical protein